MRIWTIQPKFLWEKLQKEKCLYCDPTQAELLQEPAFFNAYHWIRQQMELRLGKRPAKATHPFWGWHLLNGKNQKPDLRRTEFRNYLGEHVCLELEIPETDILLSDEEAWHAVLNDFYYSNAVTDTEWILEKLIYESLTKLEQTELKHHSWEKIFAIDQNLNNHQFVQATFWVLRLEQIVAVRCFNRKIN